MMKSSNIFRKQRNTDLAKHFLELYYSVTFQNLQRFQGAAVAAAVVVVVDSHTSLNSPLERH